ncbi:hypothetical protein TTHERM_001018288 (macronuclear) [Tetrahymena thermophila SB210]|uniref:Uncharacterized protein n=1 Tax=Tetrahymena thermophila (strain SB210) TaxID=312017 RepID=W7XE03_TETTS|nr:hypothetical protein TTHERM_001018288 [Tetrahymena thermophila SB210]EWS75852.1 hypothetical protein TTHERM_001018288 [Tetrahymena thermophila SB210]|eukprot:XP_012651608.1 hypothetical protein TTHERM_001018288 [Tetrahymena thermophila SB210]
MIIQFFQKSSRLSQKYKYACYLANGIEKKDILIVSQSENKNHNFIQINKYLLKILSFNQIFIKYSLCFSIKILQSRNQNLLSTNQYYGQKHYKLYIEKGDIQLNQKYFFSYTFIQSTTSQSNYLKSITIDLNTPSTPQKFIKLKFLIKNYGGGRDIYFIKKYQLTFKKIIQKILQKFRKKKIKQIDRFWPYLQSEFFIQNI